MEKKRKHHYLSFLLVILLTGCYQSQEADFIIHNAKIYSCDDNFSVYTAMAIKDGKILQLGPEREILNGYRCDNVMDLNLRPVYPGFHDGHCHFLAYALKTHHVDLTETKSFTEVIADVKSYGQDEQPAIMGRGWDHTKWKNTNLPTNKELNEIFPSIPVLLVRIDGHAGLANQKALDLAEITIETEIPGGVIEKAGGRLTGIILDKALEAVSNAMPKTDKEKLEELLVTAEKELFAVGLTSINDAGLSAQERDLFLTMYKAKKLNIKDNAMLFPTEQNMDWANENEVFREGGLHIRSFKILADGALGSHGACLLSPYSDDSLNHGFLLLEPEKIKEIAELGLALGYQVNTHCIGDSANSVVLKIYEGVLQGVPDHRWKIEHAQVINPKDFDYFLYNKILPSVQPTHATSDMRWAEERLGKDRMKGAYAYKTLLEKAERIILGTDFPVENINPLHTFYAAIERKDHNGTPEKGFLPDERLTRKEALLGMTKWPAYGNFEEKEKGSLETGKWADFVVLSKDIMKIQPKEILTTFVEETYLNGKQVYNAYN